MPNSMIEKKIVLKRTGEHVLCLWIHSHKKHEYVIWYEASENNYYNGQYFTELDEALEYFNKKYPGGTTI